MHMAKEQSPSDIWQQVSVVSILFHNPGLILKGMTLNLEQVTPL